MDRRTIDRRRKATDRFELSRLIEAILMMLGGIVVLMLISITVSTCVSYIEYNFIYDYQVEVTSKQGLIYSGPAACVSYETAGSSTIVRVMKPTFWCAMFQDREYVAQEVEVKTLTKKEEV